MAGSSGGLDGHTKKRKIGDGGMDRGTMVGYKRQRSNTGVVAPDNEAGSSSSGSSTRMVERYPHTGEPTTLSHPPSDLLPSFFTASNGRSASVPEAGSSYHPVSQPTQDMTGSTPTQTFRLFGLPPEVRSHIFQFAYDTGKPLISRSRWTLQRAPYSGNTPQTFPPAPWANMAVSKQYFNEAFDQYTVVFDERYDFEAFVRSTSREKVLLGQITRLALKKEVFFMDLTLVKCLPELRYLRLQLDYNYRPEDVEPDWNEHQLSENRKIAEMLKLRIVGTLGFFPWHDGMAFVRNQNVPDVEKKLKKLQKKVEDLIRETIVRPNSGKVRGSRHRMILRRPSTLRQTTFSDGILSGKAAFEVMEK